MDVSGLQNPNTSAWMRRRRARSTVKLTSDPRSRPFVRHEEFASATTAHGYIPTLSNRFTLREEDELDSGVSPLE